MFPQLSRIRRMSVKQLTIAAVVLVVALTPSVADVAHAHMSAPHLIPLVWGWIALAAIVALLAGDVLTGRPA